MDFLREDEEADIVTTPFSLNLPETTTTMTFDGVLSETGTDNPFLSVVENSTINATIPTIDIQNASDVFTRWTTQVMAAVRDLPIWSQTQHWIEYVQTRVRETTADMDPLAIVMIVLAFGIALGGLLAIVCQCWLWRRAKRRTQQRTFDTTSWLEYAFDREKFAHLDENGNDMSQPNLNYKSENLQNYYNDLNFSTASHNKSVDASLRLGMSDTSAAPIDIENCQLVQSFMRHEDDSSSGKGSKRLLVKKQNKSSLSRVEKKKLQKVKKDKESECRNEMRQGMLSGCGRSRSLMAMPLNAHTFVSQSVFMPSRILSSVSPKKRQSQPHAYSHHQHDDHRDLLIKSCSSSTASMPRPKVTRPNEFNYEVQTCALNLSFDSADTDLSDPTTIEVDNSKPSMKQTKTASTMPNRVTVAPAASKSTATVSSSPYSTIDTTKKNRQRCSAGAQQTTIERAAARQQVPTNSNTITRSFHTASTSCSSLTVEALNRASKQQNNPHHSRRQTASASAISKNPLYRESSDCSVRVNVPRASSSTTANNIGSNGRQEASIVSTKTSTPSTSYSTFTRPHRQSSSVNKL